MVFAVWVCFYCVFVSIQGLESIAFSNNHHVFIHLVQGFPRVPCLSLSPPTTNRRPPSLEAHNERLKVEMEERIAAAEQEIGALESEEETSAATFDAIDRFFVEVFCVGYFL